MRCCRGPSKLTDLKTVRVYLRPEGADLRLEGADWRSMKANIRPQKSDLNHERVDLRLERALNTGRTDSRPERAELKLKWLI